MRKSDRSKHLPHLCDGDTFEFMRCRFRVRFEHDDMSGAPDKECDGHGPVSEWTSRDKLPGERVIADNSRGFRRERRFYDVQEAIKIAKRDGWDAEPYGGTKGERAARAVERDFQYLYGWYNDEWRYVGVIVELIDADDNVIDSGSLWGVEDLNDYHIEVAFELAEGLADDENSKVFAYLRHRVERAIEAVERAYWASRDVLTVGRP